MAGLPRTVVKWLQGLDLTYQIKNPKWDLCNGFLVAEIFSWYYPEHIRMGSFNTGQSLESKMSNWSMLKKFITNNNLEIQLDLCDATMHSKDGAAILLIENMFQFLTNRSIQKAPSEFDIDFTDWPYQQQLPYYARSTAAKSIKINLKTTETNTDPNLKLNSHKVETIISGHIEHRKIERENNPQRFNVKQTIAERCVRRPIPVDKTVEESFIHHQHERIEDLKTRTSPSQNDPINRDQVLLSSLNQATSDQNKHFKEIKVKQEDYNYNIGTVN